MNVSRRAFWLMLIIVVLVLIASIAGLALKSTYARETLSWANQAKGQDIANSISIFVLVIAIYFVNKGSLKALLNWIGALLTLLNAYVIYAFAAHASFAQSSSMGFPRSDKSVAQKQSYALIATFSL